MRGMQERLKEEIFGCQLSAQIGHELKENWSVMEEILNKNSIKDKKEFQEILMQWK